jgi:hypothetical protein
MIRPFDSSPHSMRTTMPQKKRVPSRLMRSRSVSTDGLAGSLRPSYEEALVIAVPTATHLFPISECWRSNVSNWR